MMLTGFAGLGFAGYRASRKSAAVAWRCAFFEPMQNPARLGGVLRPTSIS